MRPVVLMVFCFFMAACSASASKYDQPVFVLSPASNEIITSPLRIEGRARGFWFFEGDFPVKVFDLENTLLGVGIATARGEWMTTDFVPFTAIVSFDSPGSSSGTIVFERNNPSDLPEHDAWFFWPVRFFP